MVKKYNSFIKIVSMYLNECAPEKIEEYTTREEKVYERSGYII